MSVKSHFLGARSLLIAGALLCSTGASALGQEPEPVEDPGARAQAEVLFRDRNRASLHPGNPLELVGVEQGGNDLRSRTPALLNSDRAVVTLNADDNYQRTLAMYENGERFTQPAKAMPTAPEKKKRGAWRRAIEPSDSGDGEGDPVRWFVVGGLLSALAGIGVLIWRVSAGRAGIHPS